MVASLPPCAISVSNHLLTEYKLRFVVMPKGSFFSILMVFVVPTDICITPKLPEHVLK
jgi:hypothetical protein